MGKIKAEEYEKWDKFEGEPMSDYISRQAALNTVQNMYDRCDTGSMQDYHDLLMEAFEILPSADAPHWRGSHMDAITRAVGR